METNIISTFANCIASVQLKLSDCFSRNPSLKEGITSRLSENRRRNLNVPTELVFHVGNHFELFHPKCFACGSSKVIKQEYCSRKLKLAEFGTQTIYVRRYFCKTCNKKFTTPLDVFVEKGYQYPKIYQRNVKESYKTGYCSLRHLKKILLSIYDNAPSHQTIYNWIGKISLKSAVEDSKCSGFYCYDEQYLRLNGKRFYRLSLIDSILNKPIAEEIFDNLKYGTVKSFIKRAISNKPVYAITTDHRRKYKRILDGLKINHQLCIFHLFKMIGKEAFKKLNSDFVSDRDKIQICIVFSEIKEIFRTFDLEIAVNRLETLLEKIEEIPAIFSELIQKIIKDFDRLTLFMRDGMVSRTTNPLESYYRNTIPDSLKRIFKTPNGILNYLNVRRDYWIKNISKNI